MDEPRLAEEILPAEVWHHTLVEGLLEWSTVPREDLWKDYHWGWDIILATSCARRVCRTWYTLLQGKTCRPTRDEMGRVFSPSWGTIAGRQAVLGNLNMLKWLKDQDLHHGMHFFVCEKAAGKGHLEILKWLRSWHPKPCEWDWRSCYHATAGGHLETLWWLRSQHPPCPWHKEICMEVLRACGKLEEYKALCASKGRKRKRRRINLNF